MDIESKESDYSDDDNVESNLILKNKLDLWKPDNVKSHPLYNRGYKFGKIISREDRSVIRKASKNSKENREISVVMKTVNKNKIDFLTTVNEIRSLQRIQHHLVIVLIDTIETENAFYLILEKAENGNLRDYVNQRKHLSEAESRHFFIQLINALEFCQNSGICHRDVKLDNILLDVDFNLKLADFDLAACDCDLTRLNSPFGSYGYVAPEVLLNPEYNGYKVDVWSAGICLYAMLSGRLPFVHMQQRDIYLEAIKNLTFTKTISEECQDLIQYMLNPNPNRRPSLRSVRLWKWIRKPIGPVIRSKTLKLKPKSNFNYQTEHGFSMDQYSISRFQTNIVSKFLKKAEEINGKSKKTESIKSINSIGSWGDWKSLNNILDTLQKRSQENIRKEILSLHHSFSAKIFQHIHRKTKKSYEQFQGFGMTKRERLQNWKVWCNVIKNKMID